MNKVQTNIGARMIWILVIMVMVLASCLACIIGGDGGGSTTPGAGSSKKLPDANTTATYGAEQFYIQLTAIAEPEQ